MNFFLKYFYTNIFKKEIVLFESIYDRLQEEYFFLIYVCNQDFSSSVASSFVGIETVFLSYCLSLSPFCNWINIRQTHNHIKNCVIWM